ncbi:melanoma-associated antigen B10-like isoform X2 [Portunus trituberculatus]|uniref:melanoma-associated antigen B10-like isoform X2 n=1 Tax=Portunus trituberculatus TaxID=210409 RepID=UPI001E1CE710|nr:melanoma-associated antigen B10-like isoform X2 [Portunus trituberculatus]XP_045118319.1 melanoma-associated antigen B10-like isoform X2 [Portunus trituberculatus]XP_045118320.1 melanoma-associated antigen B10-like isoform X2 [Portunus trituberculatus]XP_045118321.1 melanoma-associated antigen B10-like isoform X2 [Portunus trituberculatus]XP_045118322.1 melanoma-associated antigen B10-like isoform X2 [Portunus trituberculatus]
MSQRSRNRRPQNVVVIPLKSSEIKKSIVSLKSRSAYKIVMNKAEEMMEHLFGYKIVSVKNNSYIMMNNMQKNIIKFEQIPRNEKVRRGLLIAILAVIFMNEEKINAAGLESFLESLDFDLATSSKTTIQEFVRQRYLDTAVQDLGDASMLMYKWGDRANAEFRKKEVLECICQIYGNMKPSMWTYQWKLVNAEKNGEENSS